MEAVSSASFYSGDFSRQVFALPLRMGSTGECQQGRPHTLTHVGGLTHSRSYCYCSRRQTAQEAPTLSFKTVVFSERVRAPCALPACAWSERPSLRSC